MAERQTIKLVREGYITEVEVPLIETDHEWVPYVSAADTRKLDAVRLALRRGHLKAAARIARVFEMKPVAAEQVAALNALFAESTWGYAAPEELSELERLGRYPSYRFT